MNVNDYDFDTFPEGFSLPKSEATLKDFMEPQLSDYHPIGRDRIIAMTMRIVSKYFFEMLIVQSTFESVEKSDKDIDLTLVKMAGGPSNQIVILEMGYPELYKVMRDITFETMRDHQSHYDVELEKFISKFYPDIGDEIVRSYKESEQGVLDKEILELERIIGTD